MMTILLIAVRQHFQYLMMMLAGDRLLLTVKTGIQRFQI